MYINLYIHIYKYIYYIYSNDQKKQEQERVWQTFRTLRETWRDLERNLERPWEKPWEKQCELYCPDERWEMEPGAHRETSVQFLPKILWNNRSQVFIEILCIFSTYLCIFTYLLIALHVYDCFVKLSFSKHAEFLTLWWLAGMRDLEKVLLNLLGYNYIEKVFATQLQGEPLFCLNS